MKNLFIQQFISVKRKTFLTSYVKYVGIKSSKVIDSIIPEGSINLFSSTENFIDALVSLDEGFIAKTATPQLQAIMIPEINKLKVSHMQINKVQSEEYKEKVAKQALKTDSKTDEKDEHIDKRRNFTISPYVIFGQTMEQRLRKTDPWEKILRLGSNRYINLGAQPSQITKDHIYGFHCFYKDFYTTFQVTEGSQKHTSEVLQFQVSFQTNAANYDFIVADFNNLVQKQ